MIECCKIVWGETEEVQLRWEGNSSMIYTSLLVKGFNKGGLNEKNRWE